MALELQSVTRDRAVEQVATLLGNAQDELNAALPDVRKLAAIVPGLKAFVPIMDAEQKADALALRAEVVKLADALKPIP